MDKRLIFLLTGLGGCGKSTLLSYYVQIYGSKYSHIFLVDASSVHSIKTDLQNAVRSLGPENAQKTWEEALQYFEQDGPNRNWLIGFDSADDPSLPLHEFVPKSEHGTIFITSRNRDLFLLTTPELQWELGPMTAEEALDALLLSAQRNVSPSAADLQDGATLVEQLGGLALAVVQAGVYCFQRSGPKDAIDALYSFHQYLDEMDRNHGDLMKYFATHSLDGYDKSVYQSLNMSYSALPQLTRNFLHLCGYFHHANIPLLMLESAIDAHFQQTVGIVTREFSPVIERKLADLLESPSKSITIHLHKIIFSLKMFSLVVTSMTPNSIVINYHALVSTWSRDLLSPEQQQMYSAMATRVVSACGNKKYYLVHSLLLPHIRKILKQSGDLHLNDMNSFARRLDQSGVASEAEPIHRQMYERCVREFGRDDGRTLSVLGNLADCLHGQGLYEEAVEMKREVLDRERNLYQEDDEEILITETNLALSYYHQERWSEAEAILSRILAIRKNRGSERLDTLRTMNVLATVYSGQGRHQEAVEMGEEVLKIRRQILGKDHPDTLSSMNNLAASYIRSNRIDDAQKLEEEALEIMKDTNGKDDSDTLNAMHNLTVTYIKQGRFGDALTLGEQALDGRKRVLGIKHPDTLKNMCLVAITYCHMDCFPEGIQLQNELRELEGGEGKWSKYLGDSLRQLFQ